MRLPEATDPESLLNAFLDHVIGLGIELYPAQEEAILEIMEGKHVLLKTPTGSGKSLVAMALHFKGLAEGKRSFYTAPVKALVSEKFFALCRDFGADNVGMLTGDASINREAPIICCTAEVLSNMSLGVQAACGLPELASQELASIDFDGDGDADADHLANGHNAAAPEAVDYVVMDEFHYYSDRDRGMAWQLPLLALPNTTFLLMSATLGDTRAIEDSLHTLSKRPVAVVQSAQRPVPLDYSYRETPIHETLDDLVQRDLVPVYMVNFTQRECTEQAQNALSVNICSKEQKRAILDAIKGFRFDSPFGKDMRRYVTHGVGLHHAGLLPKYRLLVEKLAQQGLLKIIMGTDTLGVGVNVPIRTVLFTKLCKFDGERVDILSRRDFKQIAGRAGRKGFDDQGSVVCQAPEHVIENKRLENRVEANPGRKKKIVKKKPPNKNYVPWDAKTFERLATDPPETLRSQFGVNHGLLLGLLQNHARPERRNYGYRQLMTLIRTSHETRGRRMRHREKAATLLRSLRQAGIVKLVKNPQGRGSTLSVDPELQHDFSLHHTLGLYLVDTLPRLDAQRETYSFDILSMVEAILENPQVVLRRQQDKLRNDKFQELKAQGVEYDERMEELDKVTYPKPNQDFVYDTFNAFAEKHPWLAQENIRPKSVAREMLEDCLSFGEFVKEYGLQRSEGVLLRYLMQLMQALKQTVPAAYQTDELREMMVFLRTMLERVDGSLLEAWEDLIAPEEESESATGAGAAAGATDDAPTFAGGRKRIPCSPLTDPKGFRARVRTDLHRLVKTLANRDYDAAATLLRQPSDGDEGGQEMHEDAAPSSPTPAGLEAAMQPYYEAYNSLVATPEARQGRYTLFDPTAGDPKTVQVRQILVDPEGNNDWVIEATVHWHEELTLEEPWLTLERIGE